MLKKISSSLKYKFLIPTLLIILIGFSFISIISFFNIKSTINESFIQQCLIKAQDINKHINTWFLERETDISAFTDNTNLITTLENDDNHESMKLTKKYLFEQAKRNIFYEQFSIINLNGDVIVSSNDAFYKDNFDDQDFFQKTLKDQFSVSEVFKSPTTGEIEFIISVPIKSMGSIIGSVFGVVKLENFNSLFIDNVKIGDSGYAYKIKC